MAKKHSHLLPGVNRPSSFQMEAKVPSTCSSASLVFSFSFDFVFVFIFSFYFSFSSGIDSKILIIRTVEAIFKNYNNLNR